MKFRAAFSLLFLTAVLASQASAALQISNYTIYPSKLSPGTEGKVVMLLYNTGTSAITSIAIIPRFSIGLSIPSVHTIDNLGAGATTYATVPFKVLASTTPGVYAINLALSYLTMYTSLSISLTVVDEPIFAMEVINVSKNVIRLGDEVVVATKIKNAGGKAVQTYLSIDSTAFALKDAAKISLGNLDKGSELSLSLRLLAKSSVYAGAQSIPVVLEYGDDLGNSYKTTLYVAFNLNKPNVEVKSVNVTPADYASGDEATLYVTLHNFGNDAEKVTACASSAWFEQRCNYVGMISSGTAMQTSFTFTIPFGASAAKALLKVEGTNIALEREIPLTPHEKLARLAVSRVKTSPEHLVQGDSASIEVRIENYGAGDAKNTRAALNFDGEEYLAAVGKIPNNDRSTANFFIPAIKNTGVFNARLKISFEDSAGEHAKEESIQLIASAPDAGASIGLLALIVIILATAAYFYRSRIASLLSKRR